MNSPDQGNAEHAERVLTVIPDANVLIHGKALPDLLWAELGRQKIEILFVPPVIRELDKLKNQSGRPNKIARQLSSDVRALIGEPDRRVGIRKSAPTVTKRVELRKVTSAMYDALKLDHADQALINYALHLRADNLDVLLLTDDTICGTTAQEVGLPIMFLPDHWLRDPEPDDESKENAKLKGEIKRLSAAEPKVVLSFRDETGESVITLQASIARWPALNDNEIEQLLDEVQRRCPLATSFERPAPTATEILSQSAAKLLEIGGLGGFQKRSVYEPATEQEIEHYKTTAYPNWLGTVRAALGSLHENLQARTEWPTILAVASNKGTRPATEVLLAISAHGSFAILDAEAAGGGDEDEDEDEDEEDANQSEKTPENLTIPRPPAPPRGSVKTIDPFSQLGIRAGDMFGLSEALAVHMPSFTRSFTPPSPRRSDTFYWRTGRGDWVNLMELECTSWRHSQDDIVFVLKVRPDQLTDVAGAIELSVHANNISDPLLAKLPVRITFDDNSTFEEARALVEQLDRDARVPSRLRRT